MKTTIKSDFGNDTLIQELRAVAAQSGMRVLHELELGWVAGGDPGPTWDGSTPPTP